MARSIAIVCRNLVREQSTLLSVGRFELIRTVGRGGNGVVYEAFDPLRRESVALKVLYERGPSYLYRLKHEFRSLAELRHPNLIALHELSVGPDDAYFTMDLIHGCDFLAYLQDAAVRTHDADTRMREALGHLCEGVHALHCAGKLHRDLKPSNVLVTDTGRVVLLDFGLVDDVRSEGAKPEGTPAYMAPEQARGAACESSDWYSFGRVLQDALDALRRAPGGARAFENSETGRPLDRLAARLLEPDPALRPAFAEIIATLRGTPAWTAPYPAISNRPHAGPRFVGREAELRVLAAAFARSRVQPVVLRVRGESGIGKSALLRHFASTLLADDGQGARVLHGRCYERESVPFKALDSTIDELSRVLLTLPEDHEARELAGDRAALLAVFPVLGRVPWLRGDPAPRPDLNPVELRARGFAALRALLARLAAERPLLVCIDDLQWSDADSGRLLGALMCEEDSPRVLIVATDREGARSLNPAIEELQRVAELSPRPICVDDLELGPLDPTDGAALARVLVAGGPHHSAAEVAQIAADARGNPRVLSELSRWIAERPNSPAHDPEPLSIGVVLDRRLCALSEPSRAILALIAAAARPLPMEVFAAAAGIGVECHLYVKELRAAGLLRAALRGADEWLELDHDRIGEATLAGVSEDARVALHARLVRALQAEGDADEALVDQCLGAGMPFEAARCARRAAATSLAALAFTRAARLYEQALVLGDFSSDERAALHGEHAVALERAGLGLEAAAAYERAAALSADAFSAVRLEQRAADHLLRNGRYREGEALMRRGYRALGLYFPESWFALVLAIAKLLLPAKLRRIGRRTQNEQLHRARAEFLSAAQRGIENYGVLRALHNALLGFDEGEQIRDPIWKTVAEGMRGFLRALSYWPGGEARGVAELERACGVMAELGDAAFHGQLQLQLAMAHYFGGRPRAALEAANRSEACLRSFPDLQPYLNLAIGMLGSALFDLGRLREARRRWEALTHAARLHGDLMTTLWVHAQPIQLAVLFVTDERARAQAILERAARVRAKHPRYALISWSHAVCSAEYALYCGEAEQALQIVTRERRVLFGSRHPALDLRCHATRARACLDAAAALAPGWRRAALLRRAERDAAVLRRGVYHGGVSSLLLAGVAALRNRPQCAIAHLDAAIAAFAACEATLLRDSARYSKGVLLGGAAGRALTEPVISALRGEGVHDPDRYVAWLACGFRGIAGGER